MEEDNILHRYSDRYTNQFEFEVERIYYIVLGNTVPFLRNECNL